MCCLIKSNMRIKLVSKLLEMISQNVPPENFNMYLWSCSFNMQNTEELLI